MNLTRYVTVVTRRWRTVSAATAVGLLAAGAYLVAVGQSFTAQTDVNINVISTDPFNAQRSASGLLDATTEAQLATSFAVAGVAAEELGVSPDDLRGATEATVVPDATVIRIRYTARDAESAIAGADAVAAAYLAYRSQEAEARLENILTSINERTEELRASLADANARLASEPPGSTEYSQALSDRDFITLELNNLLSLKTSTESVDTAGGSVITNAVENEVAAEPGRLMVLVTGGAAGFALGVVLAFVLAAVRRRVAGRDDATAVTGAPVLGELRAVEATVPASDADLDAIRSIRERILNRVDPRGRVLLIADETAGPAASDVPLNLALALAETGLPVRVLAPRLAPALQDRLRSALKFSVSRQRGATAKTLVSSRVPGIRIVSPSDTDDRQVMSARVRALLADVGEDEATVLILPPDRDEAGLLAAVRAADAVVAVVQAGVTSWDRVREAATDDRFLGTVLVPKGRETALTGPGGEALTVAATAPLSQRDADADDAA